MHTPLQVDLAASRNKKFNKFGIYKRFPQQPTQRQGNKEMSLPLVIAFLAVKEEKELIHGLYFP